MYNKKNKSKVVEEVIETPVEETIEEVVEIPVEETEVIDSDGNTEEYLAGESVEAPVEETIEEIQNEIKVKVLAGKLNIRKEADKNSDIVAVVDKDQILNVIDSEPINNFYHVDTLSGSTGYCMVDFVEKI